MSLQFGGNKIQIGKFATGSGTNSIAIGTNARATALNSICIGESTSAAEYGISIGYACYSGTTTGTASNICIGVNCSNSSASLGVGYNIALGYGCLVTSTTSFGHTIAIGNACISAGQAGTYNVAIGTSALFNLSGGIYNHAIGWNAGYTGTTVRHNQLIGTNAGYYIEGVGTTTGYSNVCIGHGAGDAISSGNHNVCVGYAADAAATLNNQTSIGYNAVCSGAYGTAVGCNSRATINSVAFGWNAICTGNYNVAVGANAQATKDYAIAVGGGVDGGGCRSTGIGSIAIGGGDAVGNYTNANNNYNIALGRNAQAITGLNTIAIGSFTTSAQAPSAEANGAIAIGVNAHARGSDSIAIGAGSVASGADSISIGSSVSTTAGYAAYGSINQEYHRFYVSGGAGLGHGMQLYGTCPMSLNLNNSGVSKAIIWLSIAPGHYISNNAYDMGVGWTGTTKACWFVAGTTAVCKMSYASSLVYNGPGWGTISDERLKTNIIDCPSMLERCRSLKVRRFSLIDEPGKFHYGWIAQEVLPYLTEEERTKYHIIGKRPIDPKTGIEYYNLATEQLLAMNFKATQELDDLCNELSGKLASIKAHNVSLRESLLILKQQNIQLLNGLN